MIVLRVAWVADDAFITARAANNLLTGHGFRSNPPERVLAFTHPLWALLVVPMTAVLKSGYDALLFLAFLSTLATSAWLVLKSARDASAALLALLLMTASSTVVDFSTSGLENPLSHFLLLVFATWFYEDRGRASRRLFLLGALVGLNRLDLLLLILPALAWAFAQGVRKDGWQRALGLLLVGFAPLIAWESWSVFYYGSFVPNTALAKLNTTLPRSDLLRQGLSYLLDAAIRDPLLVVVTAVGTVVALVRPRSAPLGLGLLAYVSYVVWMGGDFMAGRLLTPAYVLAVGLLVSRFGLGARLAPKLLLGATALVCMLVIPGDLVPPERYTCGLPPTGIVNERLCYSEHTRLAVNVRIRKFQEHSYFVSGRKLRDEGKRVEVTTLVGLGGYAAGPDVHLIDEYALTDPLLARIPFRGEPNWRIGHFRRSVPAGYVDSVERDANLLTDPCLHELYDRIRWVTRGPLWSLSRLRASVALAFSRATCPPPS